MQRRATLARGGLLMQQQRYRVLRYFHQLLVSVACDLVTA
jgi:hypothetical protein